MSMLHPLPYGDQGDGTYRNPILHCDYSDPDVIAVGEDYYLTASSFQACPGLPILHSRDLVNWRILGYAMERFPDAAYDIPQHGKGVWAPTLRYHGGRFWIFFAAPDEGIFMTSAERPEGPWAPLHLIRAGKGLIDPCPLWDDDGQAYLVRAQAGSRCGGVNSLLTLHRMSPDGRELLDDGTVIIDGNFHHPIVEGPKLYQRNGYFYIFAPAGGVKGGWQTVFRSRSIDGPYEDRIVLIQGNTPINGPHQGAWVETAFGEHWFLHFQDRGAYGRVLHLQPMSWGDDDWPRMGDPKWGVFPREPVLQHPKPRTAEPTTSLRPVASDSLMRGELGLPWQWMANPRPEWGRATTEGLRLASQGTSGGVAHWFEAGNILVQKPLDPRFSATVEVALEPQHDGDQAGLILLSGLSGALFLERNEQGRFQLVQATLSSPQVEQARRVVELAWSHASAVLRLTMRDGVCQFFYADEESGAFIPVGEPFLPTDAAWIGARIGLFALNPGTEPSGAEALFHDFRYNVIV